MRLKKVNSTSRYLKDYVLNNEVSYPIVCVAKNQTKGYGQYDRSWLSSTDSLVFSMAFKMSSNAIDPVFSLAVALVLRKSLAKFSNNRLYVKWPNDIYSTRGKLSGCLLESVRHKVNADRILVIGIGINNKGQVDFDFSGADFLNNIDKEELLKELTSQLDLLFFSWDESFSKKTLLSWIKHDLLQLNDPVQVEYKNNIRHGIYKGLDKNGQPKILINNEMNMFFTGQVSIKPLKSIL